MKRQCNDIDIVVKSQQFDAFRAAMLTLSNEKGYPATIGKSGYLACIGGYRWRYYRTHICVQYKWYLLQIREVTGSLGDDAKTRDFTVNALYFDVENGCLLDFLEGIKDLKDMVLKGCSYPKTVFLDKSRVLRAFRFQACYGFRIDPVLLNAMKNLKITSKDRIPSVHNEANKIIESPLRFKIFKTLGQNKASRVFIQAFVREFSRQVDTYQFGHELVRLCESFENIPVLPHIVCPVYGQMDETTLLKIMISYLMLNSMPKGVQWHISDYQNQASLLAIRFFGIQYKNRLWVEKVLLLLITASRDDPRINDSDFYGEILIQIPTQLSLLLSNSSQCGSRAIFLLKSMTQNLHSTLPQALPN